METARDQAGDGDDSVGSLKRTASGLTSLALLPPIGLPGDENYLATRLPDLAAGVAFYGSAPNLEGVPKIKAPLLIQSAEVDERINASWPAYEQAPAFLNRNVREAA